MGVRWVAVDVSLFAASVIVGVVGVLHVVFGVNGGGWHSYVEDDS